MRKMKAKKNKEGKTSIKVLIWVACFIVLTIFNIIIDTLFHYSFGAIPTFIIALVSLFIFFTAPNILCDKYEEKCRLKNDNQDSSENVKYNADKMMKLWGGSIETANHDDKALFMVVYYLYNQQLSSQEQDLLNNEYVFADCSIASCCVISNYTGDLVIFNKLNMALNKLLSINSNELHEMILSRAKYFRSNIKKTNENTIDIVLPVLVWDYYNKKYVEYSKDSQIVPLESSVVNSLQYKGRELITTLIEIIESEFVKDEK